MQVVASQCIQGLAHKTLEDESSYYSCHSLTVLNPKGGSIGHHYKAVSSETEQSHYTTPKQFDEHLVEKLKYLGRFPDQGAWSNAYSY